MGMRYYARTGENTGISVGFWGMLFVFFGRLLIIICVGILWMAVAVGLGIGALAKYLYENR